MAEVMQQQKTNKQPEMKMPVNQPVKNMPVTEENKSKWWVWLIAVLIIVGVGLYFWIFG